MEATGIFDLDKLVKNFNVNEEKNFLLFKHVNELNQEIEKYDLQIIEMQSEIDINLASGGHDNPKRKAVNELVEKFNSANEEIAKMDSQQTENKKVINKLKDQIAKISKTVDCDESQNQAILGHQGITESNMFIYMGMVEQRINELLQAYAYIQAKKGNNAHVDKKAPVASQDDDQSILRQQEQIMMPGIFQHMGQNIGGLSIEPPSFIEDDENDSHDEDADFGRSRKAIKKKNSQIIGEMTDNIVAASIKFNESRFGGEDEEEEEDDEDGVDMFSAPMNSEAFMAQIMRQQQKMMKWEDRKHLRITCFGGINHLILI